MVAARRFLAAVLSPALCAMAARVIKNTQDQVKMAASPLQPGTPETVPEVALVEIQSVAEVGDIVDAHEARKAMPAAEDPLLKLFGSGHELLGKYFASSSRGAAVEEIDMSALKEVEIEVGENEIEIGKNAEIKLLIKVLSMVVAEAKNKKAKSETFTTEYAEVLDEAEGLPEAWKAAVADSGLNDFLEIVADTEHAVGLADLGKALAKYDAAACALQKIEDQTYDQVRASSLKDHKAYTYENSRLLRLATTANVAAMFETNAVAWAKVAADIETWAKGGIGLSVLPTGFGSMCDSHLAGPLQMCDSHLEGPSISMAEKNAWRDAKQMYVDELPKDPVQAPLAASDVPPLATQGGKKSGTKTSEGKKKSKKGVMKKIWSKIKHVGNNP